MNMDQHTLIIDSRFSESSSNVDFYVTFNQAKGTHTGGYPTQTFKNVTSVEMSAMSLPTTYANTSNEHYVIVDIEELNNRLHSNTPYVNQAFAIIYTEKDTNSHHKFVKGHDFEEKVKVFDPPLSTLSRLSIKLRNASTGALIDDTGYCTFIFKIKCKKAFA